ncbi:MAG: septum formation protein [Bacteroidia bacterium]|jgi:septum formation protein
MPNRSMKLVLGSASPRRKSLLTEAGLDFLVLPADVDESFDPATAAEVAAVLLAERKAHGTSAIADRELDGERPWIIGGDTLVVIGADPTETAPGNIPTYLGKPRDEQDAISMLARLSGTTHRVVTGVAVYRRGSGDEPDIIQSAAEVTFVTMRVITEAEQHAYAASGEWRGKAGGYAIQESADQFVERLEGGGFDNVVGLPVALTLKLLQKAGWTC